MNGYLRKALATVAALLAEAHTAWGDYQRLGEEARYLALRYGVPRLPPPHSERLTRQEVESFAHTLLTLLTQPVDTNPWNMLIEEWQEQQRREQAQQPDESRHTPMQTTHTDDEYRAVVQRQEEQRRAAARQYENQGLPVQRLTNAMQHTNK